MGYGVSFYISGYEISSFFFKVSNLRVITIIQSYSFIPYSLKELVETKFLPL